jgi:hypothetical protein
MKEFERLKASESTTRDEIYPCGDVIFAVLIDDVKNTRVERVLGILAIGRFVNNDPSPINLPKTDPVEIVEKNPYMVDIEATEILLATIKFVLIVVADMNGKRAAATVLLTVVRLLLTVVKPALSPPPPPVAPTFNHFPGCPA